MSKTKVILFLIAVLVIALLSHMLISCRQNYIEGFDVSSLTGGSTTPPTANASTTPTTAATTASTTGGSATTAATPTQSSLGTSPTTSPPSLLANQATGGGTTTETNGLTASPSSVTAPTTTGATAATAAATGTSATTAAATKAATASTTPTEGFGNLFGASYSSPYWNNNANMDFFANTKFKPECCKNSEYSNSSGCACMPNSQQGYLQKRGNNNNSNKPFYFF